MTAENRCRPLTRTQVAALAESLRALAEQLDAEVMTASTATRYRLDGALVALDVVLGRRAAEALRAGNGYS